MKSCHGFYNAAPLLKRWLPGTLLGNVQHQHLGYYRDAITLRFNRRRPNTRGLLFYRLAQQTVGAARHRVDPLFTVNHRPVREWDRYFSVLAPERHPKSNVLRNGSWGQEF
jgi:hypothetical protein